MNETGGRGRVERGSVRYVLRLAVEAECERVRGRPAHRHPRCGPLIATEARIVLRLVAGDSLQSAAKALGITYGTARTHLKTVFHKTGTFRQAELVIVVFRAVNDAL